MIAAKGHVSDERLRKYHAEHERETIPRGLKLKASDEDQDPFDSNHLGGLLEFWMIICIVNTVKYISMLEFLSDGERKTDSHRKGRT
jgi:hypothetical protein